VRREGWYQHPMATKEIVPLRVWLFALVILAILAACGAILFVVLDDPLKFLAARGFGTACHTVIHSSGKLP
jgi:hypothetical protein